MTDIHKLQLPDHDSQKGRLPNTTSFKTYVLMGPTPEEVSLMDCRLATDGMPDRAQWPTDLCWGVHGTSSTDDADAAMNHAANDRNPRLNCWQIEVWLRINEVKKVAASINEDAARATGFVIVPRLHSTYKAKVFEEALGFIEAGMSKAKGDPEVLKSRLQYMRDKWSLEKLFLQYPQLVWKFMEANPWAMAMVHSASVQIPHVRPYSVQFQMITFRVDPKRVIGTELKSNETTRVYF